MPISAQTTSVWMCLGDSGRCQSISFVYTFFVAIVSPVTGTINTMQHVKITIGVEFGFDSDWWWKYVTVTADFHQIALTPRNRFKTILNAPSNRKCPFLFSIDADRIRIKTTHVQVLNMIIYSCKRIFERAQQHGKFLSGALTLAILSNCNRTICYSLCKFAQYCCALLSFGLFVPKVGICLAYVWSHAWSSISLAFKLIYRSYCSSSIDIFIEIQDFSYKLLWRDITWLRSQFQPITILIRIFTQNY